MDNAMAKRNFLVTKKALSSYLNISRHTLRKRLNNKNVDISNIQEVLDWLVFEGMGIGRLNKYFARYIIKQRGMKCERCGSTEKLQIHHKISRKDWPEMTYIANNVRVLCLTCHSVEEKTPYTKKLIQNNKFFIGNNS